MGQIVSDVTTILDYKSDKEASETSRQAVLADMAADEEAKTNLVNKNLATQRAAYGASGMSASGMTETAVLDRIKSETEEPYDEKKRDNETKLAEINNSKPNLLTTMLSMFDDLV